MHELARGLIFLFFPKVPFLCRFPGDILVKRENFTYSFPLATSIIVSILICRILFVIGRLR